MKLYSYMASGRPIVATSLSTHTQVLDDDHAMLTAPVAEDYSRGIAALIDDPDLRRRLADNAGRLVRERYSVENFEKTVQQLYTQLA